MSERKYNSFKAFYPFYLTEHQDATSRTLHFIGTGLVIFLLCYAIATQWWMGLLYIPLAGYGFAWVGHFFFEKNKPATFQYPLYSLGSDFVMFFHIRTGQLPSKMKQAKKTILGVD